MEARGTRSFREKTQFDRRLSSYSNVVFSALLGSDNKCRRQIKLAVDGSAKEYGPIHARQTQSATVEVGRKSSFAKGVFML